MNYDYTCKYRVLKWYFFCGNLKVNENEEVSELENGDERR